jgi:hypothetical protein
MSIKRFTKRIPRSVAAVAGLSLVSFGLGAYASRRRANPPASEPVPELEAQIA